MSDPVPAIEVSGVSKRFGTVVALDNVSFQVARGELFFVLGPSGCGKTTLLRILAGLETPDAGVVRFDGLDTADMPVHRRGAPMVFQNYALWPHLNVRENVAFGLVERRVPRADINTRVADALREVGLSGLEKRMPGQLSGGQQQRVVLARALVLQPKVVLLDEPLSNLDAKLRLEMREELGRLHRTTPITFVYVTHDQVEALSLADRLVVMNAGRLEALGAPRDLYHRPPTRFCAEFLGEANLIPGRLQRVTGATATVETAFGVWQTAAPALDLAAGAAVFCMVRPEHLAPAAAGDTANRLEAEVRVVRMNGSTITAQLEAGGTALKAILLNRYDADLKPGVRSAWRADPGHVVILPGA